MKNFVRVNRTFKGVLTNLSRSLKHIALALMLLTLGVSNMWADNSVTIYIAINASTMKSGNNCYTLKVNANIGDNNTWRQVDAVQDKAKTTNGKLYFSATFSEKYGGVDALQIQLYNGSSWVAQRQPYSSWTTSSTFSGKMYDYDNQSWSANPSSFDASYYVYYVNTNNWSTPKAYAFSGCDENSSWSGTAMTNTGKTYNGKTIYRIQYTRRYDNIIFSNNGASQTSDLTLGTTNAGKMYNGSSWIAYNYDVTITFNMKGHGTAPSNITLLKGGTASAPSDPSEAGYTFGGWYTNSACTSAWSWSSTVTEDKTLYAKWTPKSCSITLNYQTSAAGYLSSGSIGNAGSLTATYGSAMTALTGTMPSAKPYYRFMGFYTETNGGGTKYYNSDGTSAANWAVNTTSTRTLYAYYKQAEIDALVCDPVSVGMETTDSITVTPTISPIPAEDISICWEVQYSDGTALDPQPVGRKVAGNAYRFKGPDASGSYKVQATLRKGTGCSGDVLDTKTANFTAASSHTVKVHYECGDDVIKPLEEVEIAAAGTASVCAPAIIGYAFHHWVLGDGVTCVSGTVGDAGSPGTSPLTISATYDGNLTAVYTKKRVIYFNNTNTNWSSVYVYFYKNSNYWDDNNGTGSSTSLYSSSYINKHGAMTQIAGTNVWYFDAEAAGVDAGYTTVAFTEKEQTNYNYFHKTGDVKNKVARRSDYYSGTLPMFVPISQTPVSKNSDGADYYSDGYWMNYPENTGYTLHVYDRKSEDGAVEVRTAPFEFSADMTLSMPVEVELEDAHTYGFKVERKDGNWYGNNGTMNSDNSGDTEKSQPIWAITMGTSKCGLQTTAAGTYTFRFSYGNSGGVNYLMGVKYPASVNDFQILYNDNAKWSQSSAHTASWIHPSRVIEARAGGVDTISFFVAKGNSPLLTARKVSNINAGTGAITWASLNIAGATSKSLTVSKTGVYNFKITQGSKGVISSVENIGEYTGNYYIRTDAANGKWDTYKTDEEHLMTYSSYAEAHSPANYTHFYVKFVNVNTNIKYVIANDYSPCISDTIANVTGEPVTVNSGGTMTAPASGVNIRYMWDIRTNKLSRAYLTGPISNDYFYLRSLRSQNKTYRDAELNRLGHVTKTESSTSYDVDTLLFTDIQNWIYRADLYAKPGATYKLVATVNGNTTFFRGKAGSYTTAANIDTLLGGTGSSAYHIRMLYDFRHDRMVKAWMPSGNISENLAINTDVMIVREHQEEAQQITFSPSKNLSKVHTVYGVMQFNRWILNNRANPNDQATAHCNTTAAISTYHPVLDEGSQKSIYERALYFISFPFDVKLNEVFGFGKYGTHWILSTYNGKRRAERGYFYDNCINEDCTNWDYIHEEWGYDTRSFVLKKNTGYLLSLNLDMMQYDDTTHFWTNQIHEVGLYFPSEVEEGTIRSTTAVQEELGDEYRCTINYNVPEGSNPEGDRRIKDSYWRCIGVPSYANNSSGVTDGSSTITWKSGAEMPYLYEWNVTDNSLHTRSTSAYAFKAMHAYLVQNQSEIHWTGVTAKPSSIVARKRTEQTDYEWRLELQRNGVYDDQAYVRMTDREDVTANFDFNQDLAKEFNYGHTDIYTLIGYERAAANSMPIGSTTTTVPVGVNVEYDGEYTFSMPDGTNGIGVVLVDKETNARTNLAINNYVVTLGQGQFDTRFELEISPIKNTPTGVEETETGEQKAATRKMLIDGQLYIIRDEKVFDARGIRVQ